MGLIFNIVFAQWNISVVSVLPSFPLLPPHISFSHNRAKLVKWEQTSPLIFQHVLPGFFFLTRNWWQKSQPTKNSSEKEKTAISKEYQNNVWTPASVNLLRKQRMNSSKKIFLSQTLLVHTLILPFPFFPLISVPVFHSHAIWAHPVSPMQVKRCCYWCSCKAGLNKHMGSLAQ